MWKILMVISIGSLAVSIKVPVANVENVRDTQPINVGDKYNGDPIFYPSADSTNSHLEFLNSQNKEKLVEGIQIPATYLLPPSDGEPIHYQTPEAVEQSDWYPIPSEKAQHLPSQLLITNTPEPLKIIIDDSLEETTIRNELPQPARILLPPLENARNFYFDDHTKAPERTSKKFKKPTVLYPKKVVRGYKPVPIPISQFADNLTEIPKAKPVKPFKPQPSIDGIYFTPTLDEKKNYLYEQAEQKRKLQEEHSSENQYTHPAKSTHIKEEHSVRPSEQDVSETNYRQPERGYPVPEKQIVKRPVYVPANKGERTEFRMHGMNGPHSYQFGYDTGKGKNRQFRYEERDNDGHVRGHYGYMDKNGKLRVVKYDADPELGFRADPPVVQD